MEIPLAACRVCQGKHLVPVIPLGPMPPINQFLRSPQDFAGERRFDLTVQMCQDCSHCQLSVALDPTAVFSDYLYFSSMSDTFVAHGKELATDLQKRFRLAADDLVVEIASNDGAVLKSFQELPMRVLGVEPAQNIAAVSRERGLPTVADFFSHALAEKIVVEHGQARLIFGANVLAHVLDLQDVARGIKTLLAPDGVAVIEVPYLVDLLDGLAFDTIYHEHLSYFRVAVLDRLFSDAGLQLFDVERTPIHGGSIRVFVGQRNGTRTRAATVDAIISEETARCLNTAAPYVAFVERMQACRQQARAFLEDLRKNGLRVAGYGAAAKGNVFLNYCGIDTSLMPWIADRSPHKQGLYSPGMHLPIKHPDEVLIRQPDVVVILAWNFAGEIMQYLHAYAERGGRFAVLVPEPSYLSFV